MRDLKLVTSNENKLKEFKRFGLSEIKIEKGLDLKEVDGTALEVIINKAKDAGKGMIVEDTSLTIEGASVGVNVKWLLNNINSYEGQTAVWEVFLGLNDGNSIKVYKGQIAGHIAKGETELRGFGFDSLFIPQGSDKTLYDLEKEGLKDNFSARKNAINKLMSDDFLDTLSLEEIPIWEGSYQNE